MSERALPPKNDFAGRNPADVEADRWLRRFVREGRRRGVSWQHLAAQTRRCEADLRALVGEA